MNEFEIVSPDREDIEMVQDLPMAFEHLPMTGAAALLARASFGDMLFSHVKGDGFDIWKSNYLIERSARVIGRASQAVLEFTLMYENSFDIRWKQVTSATLPPKLIELYYAPYVDNTASFEGGKQYTTIDVHFHPSFLEPYSSQFTLLGKFMESVYAGRPARLFNGTQFSSPAIEAVAKNIISYGFRDELANRYYDSYVNILLILLLERLSGFDPAARVFSATDIEHAHEARRLLTSSFEKSYTINKLCRKLGTNPYKLKTTFKHLFGTSIGKYKKAVFMDHARQLLLDTDYSLDDISFRLGYSSQQSFTTAFRNHFGYPPGYIKKKRF